MRGKTHYRVTWQPQSCGMGLEWLALQLPHWLLFFAQWNTSSCQWLSLELHAYNMVKGALSLEFSSFILAVGLSGQLVSMLMFYTFLKQHLGRCWCCCTPEQQTSYRACPETSSTKHKASFSTVVLLCKYTSPSNVITLFRVGICPSSPLQLSAWAKRCEDRQIEIPRWSYNFLQGGTIGKVEDIV